MSSGQPESLPPVSPVITSMPAASMPGVDHPHAPPADDESLYYDGSPVLGGQPEKVLGFWLVGTVFLLSPIIIWFLTHKPHKWPPGWAVIALLVVGVLFWLAGLSLGKAVRYRISNYRIDYERGLFAKDISSLELWHVEDISFHQSLLDRIIRIGTIRVISHDDSMPDLRMRGLPNARKLFEELKQRIIAVKRQSGVLKLDTGS
ncbi:MAG TPA: PH domain-containing protein [Tepidisphaeraceae bacterium]|nr:PH domain-containing protein [Tepidisphaeraceae bacterium]